jgi:hypothetical protein
MRRTLIRGLYYLVLGHDLNEKEKECASPIIADSELRIRAERFGIPLSSRLIYNVLSALLLQQEGLLDDFLLDRFNLGIPSMVATFATASNILVAQHIMAQKIWLERFCIAFRLYECEDEADQEMLEELRLLNRLMVQA